MKDSQEVTEREGALLASKLGINHLQASAETGKNIDKIFKELTKEMLAKRSSRPGNNGMNINPQPNVTKAGCCT